MADQYFSVAFDAVVDGVDSSSIASAQKIIKENLEKTKVEIKFQVSKDSEYTPKIKKEFSEIQKEATALQSKMTTAFKSGATVAGEAYRKELKAVYKDLKYMSQLKDLSGKSPQTSTQKAELQAGAINAYGAAITNYVKGMDLSSPELIESAVKEAAKAYSDLGTQIGSATLKKKKLSEITQKLTKNLTNGKNATTQFTSIWQALSAKMSGEEISLANFKLMALVKAAEILGTVLKQVANTVFELNSAMTQVQLVTMGTDEETAKLANSYSQIAKQLGVTTTTVAQASAEWFRQGKTVEEVNELVKQSTMLATTGAMESAQATEYLTAILNGFKMEATDASHIVDTLTEVDLKAATSASEIATALQKTSNSARVAGVSFEELVGMISATSESTRQSGEIIGNSFKTLLARLYNVKAGKSIDEYGESLNDVEKVLRRFNIQTRDNNQLFRDATSIYGDIAAQWDNLTNVEKRQISTAVAGTRQQEIFISLMENWGRVLELTEVGMDANGAAADRYQVYVESLQGRINSLKASWEELVYGSGIVEFFGSLIDGVNQLVDGIIRLRDAISGLGWAKSGEAKLLGETSSIEEQAEQLALVAEYQKIINDETGKYGAEQKKIAAQKISDIYKTLDEDSLRTSLALLQENKDILGDIGNEFTKGNIVASEQEDVLFENYGLAIVNAIESALAELSNAGQESGVETAEQFADGFLTSIKSGQYTDAFNEITQATSLWASAIKEMNSDGAISLDNFEKLRLVDADIVNYAYVENGQLKIRTDYLVEQFNIQRQTYIDKLKGERDELQARIANIEAQRQLNQLELDSANINAQTLGVLVGITAFKKAQDGQYDKYKSDLDEVNRAIALLESGWGNVASATDGAVSSTTNYKDKVKELFNKIIDKEVDDLQKKKSEVQDYYDERINALKEEKDQLDEQEKTQEKLLDIEKAREALAKAKQQKKKVYREGVGFVYEEDFEAVSKAQDELDKTLADWAKYQAELEIEEKLKDLEDAKDAAVKAIEDEIESLNELKNAWDDALDIEDEAAEYEGMLDVIKEFESASLEERLAIITSWANSAVAQYQRVANAAANAASAGGGGGGGSTGISSSQYVDKTTSTVRYKPSSTEAKASLKERQMQGRASGTLSDDGGLKVVGEQGPELRVLNRGDGILTRTTTRNLMGWGQFNPSKLINSLKRTGVGGGLTNVFNIGNISLPNVANTNDFLSELKNLAIQRAEKRG